VAHAGLSTAQSCKLPLLLLLLLLLWPLGAPCSGKQVFTEVLTRLIISGCSSKK
jgi:hypothetical protein